MIPAIELAKEAKVRVYIYFPPNQFSSNIATMGSGMPLHMRRYEKKFKNELAADAAKAEETFKVLCAKLDSAARENVIHANCANRKKAHYSKLLNDAKASK